MIGGIDIRLPSKAGIESEEDELYESSVIQDFALFRHVGIMEISGKPVFDGFYPLKVQ